MQNISSTKTFTGIAPTIPGYTYLGYNTTGNSTISNTDSTYTNSNVTAALNVYYLYEPAPTYSVTYAPGLQGDWKAQTTNNIASGAALPAQTVESFVHPLNI